MTIELKQHLQALALSTLESIVRRAEMFPDDPLKTQLQQLRQAVKATQAAMTAPAEEVK